jgi:hypothetical protein
MRVSPVLILSVALALSAVSCSSASRRDETYPLIYPASSRICSIKSSGDQYIGKVVVLEGIYSTDSSHYEFIEDQHCSMNNLITVEDKDGRRDPSVDAFYQENDARCAEQGRRILCVYRLRVAIEGRIVRGQSGHLGLGEGQPVVHLTRVLYSRVAPGN